MNDRGRVLLLMIFLGAGIVSAGNITDSLTGEIKINGSSGAPSGTPTGVPLVPLPAAASIGVVTPKPTTPTTTTTTPTPPAAVPPSSTSTTTSTTTQDDGGVDGQGRYTVKPGDTLWGIAQRFYGDGRAYRLIFDANPILKNPNLIIPGMKLLIPGVAVYLSPSSSDEDRISVLQTAVTTYIQTYGANTITTIDQATIDKLVKGGVLSEQNAKILFPPPAGKSWTCSGGKVGLSSGSGPVAQPPAPPVGPVPPVVVPEPPKPVPPVVPQPPLPEPPKPVTPPAYLNALAALGLRDVTTLGAEEYQALLDQARALFAIRFEEYGSLRPMLEELKAAQTPPVKSAEVIKGLTDKLAAAKKATLDKMAIAEMIIARIQDRMAFLMSEVEKAQTLTDPVLKQQIIGGRTDEWKQIQPDCENKKKALQALKAALFV